MRSATDLQGAALRVHITLTAGSVPTGVSDAPHTHVDSDSHDEELFLEEVEAADQGPSPSTPRKSDTQSRPKKKSFRATPDITSVQHAEMGSEDSFAVTVAVDQAMHLNLKGLHVT